MAMVMPETAQLQLTSKNYHSNEANRAYMSNSQYKDFRACEAMAMAKISGAWSEPESEALLVGSYVHAYFEGVLDEFKAEHPQILKKDGDLKAEYKTAEKMIAVIEQDEFAMFCLQGQKEVLITAEFAGVTWKAKMDSYNPDIGRVTDLKTCRSIRDKHWHKEYGAYVSFVEAYGYITQVALYAELERRWSGRKVWMEPLIVAVSKEDPPDKEIIGFDEHRLRVELEEVGDNMPRIVAIKNRLAEPNRCETCRYCRETKKLQRVTHYMDLLV